MDTHKVVISFDNGRPYVDWPDLMVKPKDEIEWSSADGKPFMLFFRDRPPFNAARNKLITAEKGAVRRTVMRPGDKVRAYKYFVFFHDEMLDPIIIVDPH